MAITEITNLAMHRPRVLRKLLDAETDTIEGDMTLNADNRKIAFGAAGSTDSYITFDGTDLLFFDSTVGATKTLTQLAASGSPTLDAAFDGGKTIDGATSQANSLQIGGSNDKLQIWEEASNDVRINTTAAATLALDAAGGAINVLSDSTKLGFGASGITDSYVYFDGTDLTFYDTSHGSEVKLKDMAGSKLNSPTVVGDMTFSDGKVVWTDTTDEDVLAITADSVTTNSVMNVSGDGVTTGNLLYLSATEATLNGGAYIQCYDETAPAAVFKVKEDGEIEITGAAASDMLTITAGDVQVDNGKIEVDTTQDIITYFKRNHATSTNAVVEVEQTHTGETGSVLLIDQKATGNAKALEITSAGDLACIDISASAARTGNVINIPMASQLAQTALDITGAATGTSGEGIVHVDVTGVLAGNAIRVDSTGANATTGQLLYLLSTGAQAGATNGICAYFEDTGAAAATSYTVYISSTSNEALHVDAGTSLFDERVSITLADNTGPALAITNPDTTGNTNAVTVTPSGSGAGILISPQEADTVGLKITTIASSTVPILEMDLTTGAGWIGAANKGAVDINCDGTAAHVDSTLLRLAQSGTNVSGQNGMCLRLEDTSTSGGGTEYAMYISSTNNEAIHVDSGVVVVDETLTASGGLITKHSSADFAVDAIPTAAELASTFSFTTAGQMGTVEEAAASTVGMLVFYDGTDYWYVSCTKAT